MYFCRRVVGGTLELSQKTRYARRERKNSYHHKENRKKGQSSTQLPFHHLQHSEQALQARTDGGAIQTGGNKGKWKRWKVLCHLPTHAGNKEVLTQGRTSWAPCMQTTIQVHMGFLGILLQRIVYSVPINTIQIHVAQKKSQWAKSHVGRE